DLPDLKILDIQLDSASPLTIYAHTYAGLFKSVNGGDSWVGVPGGACLLFPFLAISPSSPNILYSGCAFGNFSISTNSGKEWTYLKNRFQIQSLRVDPIAPSILYVGTFFTGVYKASIAGMQ
ncbi:MAG: WD40/YVTN/BNR-like repeat-containing protein, partial [Thiohalomonadales bacterium]